MKNFLRVTALAICAIFMVAYASAQGTYDQATMGAKVVEMETASWGQNSPFNNYCWSEYGGSTHAKAGCVPVAFAIVMRYHGFPAEGTSTTLNNCQKLDLPYEEITDRTYDWEKMPLTNGSGWTTEQQHEVAKLISHLGHAFGVSYGVSQTSVSIGDSQTERLTKYFNYKAASATSQYPSNNNLESWKQKIKESLNNGCPVPYAANNRGTGDSRHMFVIDGYTSNDYFHFNFGWNGSGNGWFKLDNITPAQGDNYSWSDDSDGYTSKHQAFFNLMPNKTPRTVTATTNSSSMGTVSINGGTAGNSVSAEVTEGTKATLTAHPADGYALANWTKNGVIVGTKNPIQVTVGESGNDYVANFDDAANVNVIQDYTINVTSGTELTTEKVQQWEFNANNDYPAALKLTSTAASINANNGAIQLHLISPKTSETYTLSVQEDYEITQYTIRCKATSTYNIKVAAEGQEITPTNSFADYKFVRSNTLARTTSNSASFTVTGDAGRYMQVESITVTVAKEGANVPSTPTTYAVTTTANPAAGGTAKFAVGTGSQKTQGDVENGTEITLYATANTGYNFVNWTLNGAAVSADATCNVSVSQAASYIASFQEEQAATPAEYPTPTGATYTNNYLTSVTTTGAKENISYTASAHPGNALVTVPGTVRVEQGKSFTLNLVANSLSSSTSSVAEDMRYCHASLFTDFDSDRTFGAAAQTWGDQPPSNNIAGNYSSVMNITKEITVPADAPLGTSHVRMIYTNAWKSWPTDGTAVLDKGIVYDIVVEVVEPSNEETLDVTFAGASWGNKATDDWWGYVTTTNTPAVTVKTTTSEGAKAIGYSTVSGVRHPYLLDGNSFTISLPANCKIVGYTLRYKGHNLNTKTFTYTGNNGTTATETVGQDGVEKTLTVTGLENNEIAISVSDQSSQAGVVIVALEITYIEEEPQELFPDGAYKVYWQADNRGYLAYHATDYPNEAKLAGVTYSGCQNLHYSVSEVDLVWYLITASDGKRYLFQAATGKFLGVNTGVDENGIANKLSTTEAWPIAVEENTHSTRQGHYIITTVINGTKNLLCSGCGTAKTGHPVRWLVVNDANQKDGGAPLQLVKVDDVTVADNVMSAVRAVIEPRTFKFKAEVDGWRNDNPNTHLGTITIGGTPLKLTPAHLAASELTMQLNAGTTLAFTRKYRGFEFQGFYIGETSLGASPTLTAENVAAINETTPLVAKFTATDDVTLFYDDDEFSYRIPAIAKTGTNRLIAVSDYRHNLFDIGRDPHTTGTKQVDLVIRKSDDNGLTWSAKQTIAEGSQDFGYGDAAIAANGENILVMAVAGNVFYHDATESNKQKTYRIYSTNNGDSWEKKEISNNLHTLFPNKYGMFFGSGKLAVDPDFNGTGIARVYGALLLKDGTRSDYNYVVYSDNWGETWNILGGGVAAYADEPKVEILPNGQILLSSRRSGGRTFNVFTYTDKANNAGTWDTATNGCDNGGNSTNGEIICLDAKKSNGKMTKILLQSQPNASDRRNVSIWYKELTGDSFTASGIADGWTKGLQVSNQLSAYSTMCLQANGEIAFYFEEAPCYADSDQKGYSMVYVPLTIEEATGNAFHNPNADIPLVTFDIELTDAQGNTYRETLDYIPNNAAAVSSYLTTKYPFIELGINGKIENNKYTNNVTLPFIVTANGKNEFWHNIYWPSYTDSYYPVYMSAAVATDEFVGKVKEEVAYGHSTYNTLEYEKELGWAVYNVNNKFEFIFKNRLTNKYIQVTDVATDDKQNVKFVESANDATVFTLLKKTGSYQGEYALVAKVGETTGYLCSSSASYDWVTHHSSNSHQGAWVKFVDGDYYSRLMDMSMELYLQFGVGNKKCVINDDIKRIKDALADYDNWNTIKRHTINEYAAIMDEAMSSWPTIVITAGENGRATINNEFEDGNVVTNKRAPVGYSLTVNALPNDGYKLKNWSKGTDAVSNATDYTFEVQGATSLTANFEVDLANRYFRLYVKGTENCMNIVSTDRITNGTSGINTTTKELNKNEQIFFFEKSDNNYKLKALNEHYITCENWFANANATGSSAATELIFEETGIELEYLIKWDNPGREDYFKVNDNSHVYSDAAITAAATWVLEEVTLCTATVAANSAEAGTATVAVGTGTGTSSVRVESGTEVTLSAIANDGYHFVNWTVGDEVVGDAATITKVITSNTNFVANFESDVTYHTITVSTYYNNNGGTVTVGEEEGATSARVVEGNSVRMLATAADGYEFMGWLKDGIIVKNAIDNGLEFEIQGPDYTLYDITASAEYMAVFSKITNYSNLEDGKAYRICAIDESGQSRCIYRDGNTLKWSYGYDNTDVNTIFVAQKNGNGVSLISGLGYHGWKASYMLGNDEQYNPYAVIKVTYGTRDELRTLYVESGTSNGLFQTNKDGAFSFQPARGGLTMTAQGDITTDFLFEEVKTYAFQTSIADGSNAKLGTINLAFATTLPERVTAYHVVNDENGYVYVEPLELENNVLPANTPVLIEGKTVGETVGKYGFKPAPASANVYETGFAGTLEAETIPGTTNAYILSYDGAGTAIKFYKLSSNGNRKINANKAYYVSANGNTAAFYINLSRGTTDLEEVKGENGEVKTIYDLQGRKLTEITEPGIYIIDGKKVWIK